jgi:hypothetical protein
MIETGLVPLLEIGYHHMISLAINFGWILSQLSEHHFALRCALRVFEEGDAGQNGGGDQRVKTRVFGGCWLWDFKRPHGRRAERASCRRWWDLVLLVLSGWRSGLRQNGPDLIIDSPRIACEEPSPLRCVLSLEHAACC